MCDFSGSEWVSYCPPKTKQDFYSAPMQCRELVPNFLYKYIYIYI